MKTFMPRWIAKLFPGPQFQDVADWAVPNEYPVSPFTVISLITPLRYLVCVIGVSYSIDGPQCTTVSSVGGAGGVRSMMYGPASRFVSFSPNALAFQ